MKRPHRHIGLGIMGFLLMLLAHPTGLRAQEHPAMGEHDPEMTARHQEMMARHEQMMARMDSLSAAMNESTGEAKVDAMAGLLNEIVAQHRAMHEHMQQMMMHRMGEGHGMKETPAGEGVPEGETDEHEQPEEPES